MMPNNSSYSVASPATAPINLTIPQQSPNSQQQPLPAVILFPDGSTARLSSNSSPNSTGLPTITTTPSPTMLTAQGLASRLISTGGHPQRNVVFQWSSPSSRRHVTMPEVSASNHPRTESQVVDRQIHGSMTTPASGRPSYHHHHHGSQTSKNKENVPKRSVSRPPLSASVQTSIQTTTTGSPVDGGSPILSQDCSERNAMFDQLTAQLEQVHQMFRDGLLEAKEYHKRVADLMVQLHTCHPQQTASILSPAHVITTIDGSSTSTSNQSGSNIFLSSPNQLPMRVITTSTPHSPMLSPQRFISTNSTIGGNYYLTGQPATVVSPSVISSSISHTPTTLSPMIGTVLPTQLPVMTPLGQAVVTTPDGKPFTTTTTTTTTRRRTSNLSQAPSSAARGHPGDAISPNRHAVMSSSLFSPFTSVALGPSEMLLMLKLLEREQGAVSHSQVVALMYSVVADAGRALEYQLKANLDSNSVAPEIRRILTSSTAASTAATELGSFANSLYKALKRSEIRGLNSKHNRLRLLATEASTRRWRGRELLEFVATLLQALETDLTSSERVIVLKALAHKLKRRAGTTESLGELYRAFDVVFPGSDEDADVRMSLHRERSLRSLTFVNDACHGCRTDIVGFRFRCVQCHGAAVAQGLDSIGARRRLSSSAATSVSTQTKTPVEFILCSNCFISCCSTSADDIDNSIADGNDSFETSHLPSATEMIRHKEFPDLCSKQFVCEIPFSVLSPSSRHYRPLRHLSVAPTHGWGSAGAAALMHDGNKAHERRRHHSTVAHDSSLPRSPEISRETPTTTVAEIPAPAMQVNAEIPEPSAYHAFNSEIVDRFRQLSGANPNTEMTILPDGRIQMVSQIQTEMLTHTDHWEEPDQNDRSKNVHGSLLISEQSVGGTGQVNESRAVNTLSMEDSTTGQVNTYSVAAVADVQRQLEPSSEDVVAIPLVDVMNRDFIDDSSPKSFHHNGTDVQHDHPHATQQVPDVPSVLPRKSHDDRNNVSVASVVPPSSTRVSISSDDSISIHNINNASKQVKRSQTSKTGAEAKPRSKDSFSSSVVAQRKLNSETTGIPPTMKASNSMTIPQNANVHPYAEVSSTFSTGHRQSVSSTSDEMRESLRMTTPYPPISFQRSLKNQTEDVGMIGMGQVNASVGMTTPYPPPFKKSKDAYRGMDQVQGASEEDDESSEEKRGGEVDAPHRSGSVDQSQVSENPVLFVDECSQHDDEESSDISVGSGEPIESPNTRLLIESAPSRSLDSIELQHHFEDQTKDRHVKRQQQSMQQLQHGMNEVEAREDGLASNSGTLSSDEENDDGDAVAVSIESASQEATNDESNSIEEADEDGKHNPLMSNTLDGSVGNNVAMIDEMEHIPAGQNSVLMSEAFKSATHPNGGKRGNMEHGSSPTSRAKALKAMSSSQLSRELSIESGKSDGPSLPYNSRPTISSRDERDQSGESLGVAPKRSLSNRLMNNSSARSGAPVNQTIGALPSTRISSKDALPRSFSGSNSPVSASGGVWGSGAATHRVGGRQQGGMSPVAARVAGVSGFSTARATSKSTTSVNGWSRTTSRDDLISPGRAMTVAAVSTRQRSGSGKLPSSSTNTFSSHSGIKSATISDVMMQQHRAATNFSAPTTSRSVSSTINGDSGRGFASSLSKRRSRALAESAKVNSTMRF